MVVSKPATQAVDDSDEAVQCKQTAPAEVLDAGWLLSLADGSAVWLVPQKALAMRADIAASPDAGGVR